MKGSMNMYTMKDLMEKATKISCYAVGDEAYDFEGHRIAICGCDRSYTDHRLDCVWRLYYRLYACGGHCRQLTSEWQSVRQQQPRKRT